MWLLPSYMVWLLIMWLSITIYTYYYVAIYYEQVRRTMRTAIVSNLFKNIFQSILASTYWLQPIRKSDSMNFYLFVYLQSYNDKSKILFLQTLQSSRNMSHLRTSHFSAKCYYRLFSSNIPLTIEKNLVESQVSLRK